MNNRRRERLRTAVDMLRQAKLIVDHAADEEQDALDNMPENLEDTERYSRMEEAADSLTDACDSIDDAIGSIEEAIA